MKRTELNLAERRTIEDPLHRKVKVTEIARRINRHRATVYREIKRNFFKDDDQPQLDGYYGMLAQKSTAERRAQRRKLVRIPELRDAVIDRLQEGWSPEQIAGRLKLEGHSTTVSHETIYAYVYSPDGQSQALARYLPDRRKKRKTALCADCARHDVPAGALDPQQAGTYQNPRDLWRMPPYFDLYL